MVPFDTARLQLIAAGARIHARGWAPATSGNYSVRVAPDRIAITCSGKDKSALEPGDVMALGLDGTALSAGRPSAEAGLHLALYRRDPAIGAVLHSHSLNSVLVSTKCVAPGQRHLSLTGLELLKAFAGVDSHEAIVELPVFDNDQDIDALARAVDAFMDQRGQGVAYLIRGHGTYTWGRDLAEAERHLEALEFLLEYLWQTRTVSEPT